MFREEVVGTVIDHLEECRLLAQKRHGESAFSSVTSRIPSDPLLTSLPDIDQPGFQVLRKNDQVIVCIRERRGGENSTDYCSAGSNA